MGEAQQPRFRTASPPRLSRGNAPRFSFRLNSGPLGHKCRSTAPIGCRPRPAFKATPASREWAVVAPLGAGSTSRSSAARDRARERPVRRKGALLGDSVDAPVHVPEQAGEPGSGGLRLLLAADGGVSRGQAEPLDVPASSAHVRRFVRPSQRRTAGPRPEQARTGRPPRAAAKTRDAGVSEVYAGGGSRSSPRERES